MEIKNFSENLNKLSFYFPYPFARHIKEETKIEYVMNEINSFEKKKIKLVEGEYLFVYKKMEWETNYFDIDSYKLFTIIYSNEEYLAKAIAAFINFLPKQAYIYGEFPSEENILIQHLGLNKFRLVETRLTYYHSKLPTFDFKRFKVREANSDDVDNLKRISKEMRNSYDRFHSDIFFDQGRADEYLSTYIENSIKGFTDIVLVPDVNGIASDSFLTANFLKEDWEKINLRVSKMVLSAVSNQTNKGWYVKLISEMTYYLYEKVGVEAIVMNTQSTNKAVFHTWEKLGYKLSHTTHILAYFKN